VAQVEARLNVDSNDAPFRATLARSLNQSLRQVTGSWGVRDKVQSALGTFKAFSVKTDPSGGLDLGIDVEPRSGRADTGSLELDLSSWRSIWVHRPPSSVPASSCSSTRCRT
jgi:hypothetical protein